MVIDPVDVTQAVGGTALRSARSGKDAMALLTGM
jgi:hypothetical protein